MTNEDRFVPTTDNREAMTLEQVRGRIDYWINARAGLLDITEMEDWRDAIDAHLSRAADPVAWIIEHDNWYHGSVTVRRLSGGGFSYHVLNDAEAQSLCALLNADITPRPSEDARCPYIVTGMEGTSHCRLAEQDARDAKRYQWLLKQEYPKGWPDGALWWNVSVSDGSQGKSLNGESITKAIDAAMNGGDDE